MSLGDGQILNRVGEAFSAKIALSGSYSKDVSFSQVGNAECRSSVIGNTTNGCESLYAGQLSFSIKRRPDGRYFLSVAGGKSDELFYRILIKSTSASTGSIFKLYEFLPEFNPNPDEDEPPVVANDGVSSRHGIVDGQDIEPVPDAGSRAAKADLPKAPARQHEVFKPKQPNIIKPNQRDIIKPKQLDIIKDKRDEVLLKKPVQTHLEIKKSGEYADDIQALTKENGEIEAQISLLEKHIGLLKEVIRLKSEVGAVPETAVVIPKPAPVLVQTVQSSQPGLLTWILLAVVFVFAAQLVWMSQKIKRLSLKYGSEPLSTAATSTAASAIEKKSLDLTGAFIKPKW